MSKILVICGPTAVGKTSFGIQLAKKFSGEIVSADSRQVYIGMDVVTGKDKDLFQGVPVWLYDLVRPDEPFSVALWHERATSAIAGIHAHGRLPIVVGGTGLYIRSLIEPLSRMAVPPNQPLRQKLSGWSATSLFDHLHSLRPNLAASLNASDRVNPRRLVRHIEIASTPTPVSRPAPPYNYLTLVLTAPLDVLKSRIAARLDVSFPQAQKEYISLIANYDPSLPSFTACGYRALSSPAPRVEWLRQEYAYARRQLTWLRKFTSGHWIDTSIAGWPDRAGKIISAWYN